METREIIRKLSDLGVPQEDMASISGVSQGRISQILNDGGDCSFSAGKRLSEFLEKKIFELSKELVKEGK